MTQGLHETRFSIGRRSQGKVRDVYALQDVMAIVATDRHSVFDRSVADIPGKGQVLNRLSAYWFERTLDIVPNHVIAVPDPNAMIVRRCSPIAIEAVVRGYVTGSTSTSLWCQYSEGRRDFGHFQLANGLRKNQRLDEPVFTPSTKDSVHDRSLSIGEAVELGLVSWELIRTIERIARRLFARGQSLYAALGLILVDSKYEFGTDAGGQLVLIDEIHTPDSSRIWEGGSYPERFARAEEPIGFDKERLRLWYAERCDPYRDEPMPEPPPALLAEVAARYVELLRRVTGRELEFAGPGVSVERRIGTNLRKALATGGFAIDL